MKRNPTPWSQIQEAKETLKNLNARLEKLEAIEHPTLADLKEVRSITRWANELKSFIKHTKNQYGISA